MADLLLGGERQRSAAIDLVFDSISEWFHWKPMGLKFKLKLQLTELLDDPISEDQALALDDVRRGRATVDALLDYFNTRLAWAEYRRVGTRIFPRADVAAARRDRELQEQHSPFEARGRYMDRANSCPTCGAAPTDLHWTYFRSPDWTWERRCGRAGWLTSCDHCGIDVDFFVESMS